MRIMFLFCASLIAIVYYVGASHDSTAIGRGMTQLAYTMTGRNAEGQFIETTIEEVEDESPYYFPDTPKEELADMRYYA